MDLRTVEILDTEEKGSDVNLASYLLLDGFEDAYEMAVVVSNDSDLQLPIKMVRTTLEKTGGRLRSKRETELRASRCGFLVQTIAPRSLERKPVPRHPFGWSRYYHEACRLVGHTRKPAPGRSPCVLQDALRRRWLRGSLRWWMWWLILGIVIVIRTRPWRSY